MTRVHPWVDRGLGRPPFQFFKFERREKNPTTCDVCGRKIMQVYWVKDATDTNSKTGSECIIKSEPSYSKLSEDAKKAKKNADSANVAIRVASVMAAVNADPSFLADERSPYRTDKTLREWATFAIANGGEKKRLEVCRSVEAYAAKRKS